MNHSVKTGFSFGLTSGVITTLGLMVGIESATASKLAVVGAILTIAVADALSDALGIHMSEESVHEHTQRQIWESTFSTLIFKFFFAMVFLIPVLLLNLDLAVWVSVGMGILILGIFSYQIAKEKEAKVKMVILEHLLVAALVVTVAKIVGSLVAYTFPA